MIENDAIVIKVKDTGIGIEKDKLEYIFERFKQVELDLSRSYGGLGVGLTIVKGFINCMNGSIDINSEIDKGSEFIVRLPYNHASETLEKTGSEKRYHSKKIRKVLIAEDDEHNYLYLERILKKKKMDILYARNGKEAVELFKKHTDIQVVLMDIKMPVMDGLKAFQEIRNIRPEVKVIAVTAYALDHEKDKYKSHGFDGYLTKPVSREEILDLFK
jgi:CheY-like chemotaxis protein